MRHRFNRILYDIENDSLHRRALQVQQNALGNPKQDLDTSRLLRCQCRVRSRDDDFAKVAHSNDRWIPLHDAHQIRYESLHTDCRQPDIPSKAHRRVRLRQVYVWASSFPADGSAVVGFFRGLVSDDENDQAATGDAFDALYYMLAKRLARGRLTVVDVTNVRPEDRKRLIEHARQYHCFAIAVVLNASEKTSKIVNGVVCRTRTESHLPLLGQARSACPA